VESVHEAEYKERVRGKNQEKRKTIKDELIESEVSGVYYLPPEVKVAPDERARVIGKLRKKMDDREVTERVIKGRESKKNLGVSEKNKLETLQDQKKKKDAEEFQKNMANYEKEKKMRAIERTLGINSSEEYSPEYEGMSAEMVDIVRKNKELEKNYQKKY
jgi:hypothetical protein